MLFTAGKFKYHSPGKTCSSFPFFYKPGTVGLISLKTICDPSFLSLCIYSFFDGSGILHPKIFTMFLNDYLQKSLAFANFAMALFRHFILTVYRNWRNTTFSARVYYPLLKISSLARRLINRSRLGLRNF